MHEPTSHHQSTAPVFFYQVMAQPPTQIQSTVSKPISQLPLIWDTEVEDGKSAKEVKESAEKDQETNDDIPNRQQSRSAPSTNSAVSKKL